MPALRRRRRATVAPATHGRAPAESAKASGVARRGRRGRGSSGTQHQRAEQQDEPADDVADGADVDHDAGAPPAPWQTGQSGRAAGADAAGLGVERVVDEERAAERRAGAGDELDRLERHHRAHDAGERADHAGLGAGGDELGRRRLGEEALVAGAAARRVEERDLALPLAHRRGDERAAGGDAGGVDEVAGGEVVAAVEDEVVGRDEAGGDGGVEAERVRLDGDVRVEAGERAGGALGLRLADLGGGVQDLALQVREADRVVVDDAEGADAGGGEVEERRAAEAAGADDEHAGGARRCWPGPPISCSTMWRA